MINNFRDIVKFILLFLLIHIFASCDVQNESSSKENSKVSDRPNHLTAWALGADSKNLSKSDLMALSSLDTLSHKWNNVTAIIIRDYQDPTVSVYKWIEDTRYNIAELRKIHMLMNVNLISMGDINLKETVNKIVENYRDKLDGLILLHNAVATGDALAYEEATFQIKKASEEARKISMEYFNKIRPHVNPDSLTENLRRRAERIADKMKPEEN